ncbi:MAG: hypothetical protein E7443_00220 [Ruminococcaceae bacterium]|nr:hypothetical protein [Oscillospiraceae bacterium]
MAKHEFGIMPCVPGVHERYDAYEPEKYGCIAVDDALIECIAPEWSEIDTYWHTTDCPAKGLAYCGVTLIPPESLHAMTKGKTNAVSPLKELFRQAAEGKRFVIHFGL